MDTYRNINTFNPTGNSILQVHWTCAICFWTVEWDFCRQEERMQTHAQNDLKPGPSCCEVSPCGPLSLHPEKGSLPQPFVQQFWSLWSTFPLSSSQQSTQKHLIREATSMDRCCSQVDEPTSWSQKENLRAVLLSKNGSGSKQIPMRLRTFVL